VNRPYSRGERLRRKLSRRKLTKRAIGYGLSLQNRPTGTRPSPSARSTRSGFSGNHLALCKSMAKSVTMTSVVEDRQHYFSLGTCAVFLIPMLGS
jgi:hypothetical protein